MLTFLGILIIALGAIFFIVKTFLKNSSMVEWHVYKKPTLGIIPEKFSYLELHKTNVM